MQLSFILSRNDLWLPNRRINKIYSLSQLGRIFGKDTAIYFHPIIKKILLCSNYEFWYSNYPMMLSVILNCLLFNILIGCYTFTDSDKMKIDMSHMLLMNIPNLISIASFILLLVNNNSHIQREMNHYLNYFIINTPQLQLIQIKENKDNEKYCISFNINFDLIISQKINSHRRNVIQLHNLPRQDHYFEYVINIPNSPFRIYHYEALLERKEKEIIREMIVYLHNQDLKSKRKRLHFFFISLIWLILLYFQKESITIFVTFAYLIMIGLLYYLLQIKHLLLKINQLKQYISEVNKEIINEGYYIDVSEYLISLFAIKRNQLFNIEEAQQEVELIKMKG